MIYTAPGKEGMGEQEHHGTLKCSGFEYIANSATSPLEPVPCTQSPIWLAWNPRDKPAAYCQICFPNDCSNYRRINPAFVTHGNQNYGEDLLAYFVAHVHFVSNRSAGGDLFLLYKLEGGHVGAEIYVEVKNPRVKREDDGWTVKYDGLYWADDGTEFRSDGGWLEDTYLDLLREDIDKSWRYA